MVIEATHTTGTDHDTSCSLTLKHYSEATLLSYCARAGGAGTPSSALTAPPAASARSRAATAACHCLSFSWPVAHWASTSDAN